MNKLVSDGNVKNKLSGCYESGITPPLCKSVHQNLMRVETHCGICL